MAFLPLVHRGAIVIDGQSNSVLTEEQFGRFRAGGVTAINCSTIDHGLDLEDALVHCAEVVSQLTRLPHCYLLVKSALDIDRAKHEGRVGVILGLQNGKPLQGRIENIESFHEVGVRIVQLTYNQRNLIGNGWLEPADEGLTAFGRVVVAALNRSGILIDLSHCGPRTAREAIDASEVPVTITHANPSHISPSRRNKDDEVLRALAGRGGVLGLTAFSPLAVTPDRRPPVLEDFLDSIVYAADLMGIDHVGIGTDHVDGVFTREEFEKQWGWQAPLYHEITEFIGPWYNFDTKTVVGFESAALWGNLTEGLLRRRYAEEAVRKVLGANFLRVFRATWL